MWIPEREAPVPELVGEELADRNEDRELVEEQIVRRLAVEIPGPRWCSEDAVSGDESVSGEQRGVEQDAED